MHNDSLYPEEEPATQQHVYVNLYPDLLSGNLRMEVQGPEGLIVHLIDWRDRKIAPSWRGEDGPEYEPPPELVQAATPLPDLTTSQEEVTP